MDRGLQVIFAKTDLGEAEWIRPSRDLPRPARQLLQLVDEAVPIDDCVAGVDEGSLADAMLLLDQGLIRLSACHADAAVAGFLKLLVDALLALPPHDLYSLLTDQAKRRLGLLQGFRMVLALERCANRHEQSALAVRFVQLIWRMHGAAGIRPLKGLLKV